MSNFDTSSQVKARKLHRCCECHGAINPGDTYEKAFIVQDGDASNFKTCQKCAEARDWLLNETDWPGDIDGEGHSYFFTMLRDHLREQGREADRKYAFRAYRLVVLMDTHGLYQRIQRGDRENPRFSCSRSLSMTTDITELAQSLKAAAENAIGAHERLAAYPYGEIIDISQHEGEQIDIDITDLNEFNKEANPVNILALVEALEKAQQHENEWKSLCEAAAVDLDDWREIDDKSRDLLCKLADTVIAKAEQSAEWERKAISNFEDCAEMSARLEELESQRKLAFAASNRWADKFREAEKRIAELEFIRTSADKVQREFADELSCAGDNESILQAIEDLKMQLESRTANPVTYSENADADHCRKWAWEQVKGEVSTEGWTSGDNANYFGFFCWGWDMRRQYNEQRPVTVKLPPELSTIGELIRTQDNRITDQPIFVVFQKREIIGSDEHSPSRICWIWDGEEVSELRANRLEALYQDGRDTRG